MWPASRSAPGTAAAMRSAPSTTRCAGRCEASCKGRIRRIRRRRSSWPETEYGEGQPNDDAVQSARARPFRPVRQRGRRHERGLRLQGQPAASKPPDWRRTTRPSPDWSTQSGARAADVSRAARRYDALNRPDHGDRAGRAASTGPRSTKPTCWRGSTSTCAARRRRRRSSPTSTTTPRASATRIEYGNGVTTEYAYDPLTFRLIELKTTRLADQAVLQDLSYTYDPAGNITHIRDDAQQTIYFNNQVVAPTTTIPTTRSTA